VPRTRERSKPRLLSLRLFLRSALVAVGEALAQHLMSTSPRMPVASPRDLVGILGRSARERLAQGSSETGPGERMKRMQWHFRASVYILRLTHKKKRWDALVVCGHRCSRVARVSGAPVRLLVWSCQGFRPHCGLKAACDPKRHRRWRGLGYAMTAPRN
jgi:hypothetical protein